MLKWKHIKGDSVKENREKKLGDGILLKTYGAEIEDKRIYEYSVPRKKWKGDTILFGVGQMKENKRYAKNKN